jgi:tetratricopeptide (TPR) repeat protein
MANKDEVPMLHAWQQIARARRYPEAVSNPPGIVPTLRWGTIRKMVGSKMGLSASGIRVWKLLVGIVAALAIGAGAAAGAPGDPPAAAIEAPAPSEVPPASEAPAKASDAFDDPAEPFTPLKPRGGRELDRVRALALFAAGRVAEQKQDYPQALRRYQRAFRYDPDSTAALREIVPLAFNLDRQAEAVRYALIMAERDPTDPVLLRRLAIYLTEAGDTQRALALYEKALALQAAEKQAPSLLVSRMEMGRLYFVAKKFAKAADEFAVVLKALENPKDFGLDESMQKALAGKAELTYQLVGESFLAADRPAEALAAFEKAHAAKADEGLHAYNLARVDMKQKQPAQALAKLELYFDKHVATQGTPPYQVLAEALAELGQSERLGERLEKLRAADPGNVPLTYFLAEHYRGAGQLDKAEPLYAQLISQNPSRPPLEAFQGQIAVLHKQKNADKLLATLGEAVARVGTFGPLGESGKAVLEDTEISKSIAESADRRLSSDAASLGFGPRMAAALVSLQVKDFEAANKYFDLAMAAEPKKAAETLVTWGLELFTANQYADAVKVFQRGLDDKLLPETNPTLYFYLAGALAMAGRTDEAIAAADKAAELEKDSPRFASRAAWIKYHAKRYDEARKSYHQLLEKYDKKYDSREARDALRDARLVMSNISVLENKLPESEEWLEQVLDEFPEDVGALNDLGYLWADSGKHLELALDMIQKAVAHEPKNMAYRDSLGWVLFRLKRFPEAVAELKVAAAVDQPDGVILDHLGDALAEAGDAAGAIDAWNRAATAFEKSSDTEKAKQSREKASRANEKQEKK